LFPFLQFYYGLNGLTNTWGRTLGDGGKCSFLNGEHLGTEKSVHFSKIALQLLKNVR